MNRNLACADTGSAAATKNDANRTLASLGPKGGRGRRGAGDVRQGASQPLAVRGEVGAFELALPDNDERRARPPPEEGTVAFHERERSGARGDARLCKRLAAMSSTSPRSRAARRAVSCAARRSSTSGSSAGGPKAP